MEEDGTARREQVATASPRRATRRLGGGIRASVRLTLAPAEVGTRVRIDTDLAVLGRIGEFGQPVIRKKADALLEEFARNLRSALAA